MSTIICVVVNRSNDFSNPRDNFIPLFSFYNVHCNIRKFQILLNIEYIHCKITKSVYCSFKLICSTHFAEV